MVEIQRLEADLRRTVSGEVRFDNGMRAAYAADASNYRQVPIGVVLPRTAQDIVATLRLCRDHGAPVLARGLTDAARDAVVMASGFSCREQIETLARRPTLHLAELLAPQ